MFTAAFVAAMFAQLFTAQTPDCVWEDGSELAKSSVCKWDATDSGNREGDSFVVIRTATGDFFYFYANGEYGYSLTNGEVR